MRHPPVRPPARAALLALVLSLPHTVLPAQPVDADPISPGDSIPAEAVAGSASAVDWRFSGRLHLDQAAFKGTYARDGRWHRATYLRRADLGASVRWHPQWRATALLEREGDGRWDWATATLDWLPRAGMEVRFGRIDPDFGLEPSASSSWSAGVERSSIWDLAPDVASSGDGFGVRLDAHGRAWQASAGVYDKRDHSAWVARAVMLPIHRKRTRLHLGASIATTRGWQDDGRIRTRLGVRGVDEDADGRRSTLARAARSDNAYDGDTSLAVELAWQRGPWMLQTELLQRRLSGANGRSTRTAQGAYAQLAWVVSGEQRRYDERRGRFGSARPSQPGGGAWEVFYRLDGLEVKKARSATVHSAGLNWTAHQTWRATLSVHRARSGDANRLGQTTGTGVSLRLQALF